MAMRRYVLRSAKSAARSPAPAATPPAVDPVDALLEDALSRRKRKETEADDGAEAIAPPAVLPPKPIIIEEKPEQPLHPFFLRKNKAVSAPAASPAPLVPAVVTPMQLSLSGTAAPGQPVHTFFTARPAASAVVSRPLQPLLAPPPLYRHVTQAASEPDAQRKQHTFDIQSDEHWQSVSSSLSSVPRASLVSSLYSPSNTTDLDSPPHSLISTSSPSLLFSSASKDALFEQILQLVTATTSSPASDLRTTGRALLQRFKTAIASRGSDLLPDALQPTALDDVIGAPHSIERGRSLLCTGPQGAGKSALVSVLRGTHFLEIPACTNRDRAAVMRSVEEATQSQAVGTEGTTLRETMLVFEEIDVVFESDKGFHSALSSLLSSSKVPILLTANQCPASLRLPSHVQHVEMPRPSYSAVLLYGLMAWLALAAPVSLDAAHAAILPAARKGDYRAALMALSLPLSPLTPPSPTPLLPIDIPASLDISTSSLAPSSHIPWPLLARLASLTDCASALDVVNASLSADSLSPSADVSTSSFYLSDPTPHPVEPELAPELNSAMDALLLSRASITPLPRRPSSHWRSDAKELRILLEGMLGQPQRGTAAVVTHAEALSVICAAESLRRTAAAKRRFLHYLQRFASANDVAALEQQLLWPSLPPALLPAPSPTPQPLPASGPVLSEVSPASAPVPQVDSATNTSAVTTADSPMAGVAEPQPAIAPNPVAESTVSSPELEMLPPSPPPAEPIGAQPEEEQRPAVLPPENLPPAPVIN